MERIIRKDYDKRLEKVGFKSILVNQNNFLSHSESIKYGLDLNEKLYIVKK